MRTSAIRRLVAEERIDENNVKDIGDFIIEAQNKELQDNSSQKGENPRIVPLKLSKEEAKRAFVYQKTLLNFAIQQYKKAKGTEKEDAMRRLYQDAVRDYNDFVSEYKEELS